MKLRAKTRDVAFQFRMGAGFPGDVNRTHPVTIEPTLIDASAPPAFYGEGVIVDATTQGVRPLNSVAVGGDVNVTQLYGVTVRPFPIQQASASNFGAAALGAAAPPTSGQIDTMRAGYIIVSIPAGQNPSKGDPVYIWTAASSGAHVQGGFEAVIDHGTNTTPALTGITFNGHPDANGNVEIAFNI